MMSDITLNPAQRQPTVTDTTNTTTRPASQTNSASTSASSSSTTSSSATGDQVNLSPAAQIASASYASNSTLDDDAAVSTSLGLRQSIGSNSLSVSAKQNQAILSLLR